MSLRNHYKVAVKSVTNPFAGCSIRRGLRGGTNLCLPLLLSLILSFLLILFTHSLCFPSLNQDSVSPLSISLGHESLSLRLSSLPYFDVSPPHVTLIFSSLSPCFASNLPLFRLSISSPLPFISLYIPSLSSHSAQNDPCWPRGFPLECIQSNALEYDKQQGKTAVSVASTSVGVLQVKIGKGLINVTLLLLSCFSLVALSR
jgi:hypothetical protein